MNDESVEFQDGHQLFRRICCMCRLPQRWTVAPAEEKKYSKKLYFVIPVRGREGPYGCETSKLSHFP
jgi:hypothetical protein